MLFSKAIRQAPTRTLSAGLRLGLWCHIIKTVRDSIWSDWARRTLAFHVLLLHARRWSGGAIGPRRYRSQVVHQLSENKSAIFVGRRAPEFEVACTTSTDHPQSIARLTDYLDRWLILIAAFRERPTRYSITIIGIPSSSSIAWTVHMLG